MKSGIASLYTLLSISLLLPAGPAHADVYDDVSKLQRAGNAAQAETLADQHLQANPKDPQMRYLKGLLLRDEGKTQQAIETFSKLIEDYPELPEPYNSVAVLQASLGDYDKARTALEGALLANPSYATAHENLGDIYTQLARQSYCQALKYAPRNTDLKSRLQARAITCP